MVAFAGMASSPSAAPVTGEPNGDWVDPGAWRTIDWREHQRWVTVEERPVNVIDVGEGPAIVFVHGWDGSWQNWLENIPFFARGHRVIALDLPGFGHSPTPREPISITGYARIVDGLLEALGVDSATVVGNSMGGFIAAETALRHADRVTRLVLVSAAGLAIENQRRQPDLTLLRILGYGGIWMATRSEAFARRPRLRAIALGVVTPRPLAIPADFAFEQLQGQGKKGHLAAFEAMLAYSFRKRLPEIGCPTLIVWGDRDRLVPVSDADEFARLIPNSRKIVYEGWGHCAMFEVPERFNADVAAFAHEAALSA